MLRNAQFPVSSLGYICFPFSFTLAATTAGDLAFNERNTTWWAIREGERTRGVLRVDYGGDLSFAFLSFSLSLSLEVVCWFCENFCLIMMSDCGR